MLKPSQLDPLKNRRLMAFIAAAHGFFVWPYVISILSKHYQVSDELCNALLHYMEVVSCGPLAAYFVAAHKQDGMSMKDFIGAAKAQADAVGSSFDPNIIPGAEGSSAVSGLEGED